MPKNHEQILTEITALLERSPEVDASDVALSVSEGVVTLSGSVKERREMQTIERLVLAKSGINGVNNQLTVRRADDYKTPDEIARDSAAGSKRLQVFDQL